jgi:hypothetical protein
MSDMVKGMSMNAEAMAEMQQIKAADDELGKAYKMYLANPSDYRKDMFLDAVDFTDNTGTVPEGGYLFESIKDPALRAQDFITNLAGNLKKKDKYFKTEDSTNISATKREVKTTSWFDTGLTDDELINLTYTAPSLERQPYHIDGFFQEYAEKEDPEGYRRALEAANGDEAIAADLFYRERVKKMGLLPTKDNPSVTYEPKDRWPSSKDTETERDWYGIREDGLSLGLPRGGPTDARKESLSSGKRSVVFSNSTLNSSDRIELPVSMLTFSDPEINKKMKAEGGDRMIRVWPSIGEEGKIKVSVVDPISKVKTVKGKFGDNRINVPFEYRKDSKPVFSDDEKFELLGYQYEEKVEGLTATATPNEALPLLNPYYRGQLIDFWDKVFGEEQKKTEAKQEEVDFSQFKRK